MWLGDFISSTFIFIATGVQEMQKLEKILYVVVFFLFSWSWYDSDFKDFTSLLIMAFSVWSFFKPQLGESKT